jgi:hypothetical protein
MLGEHLIGILCYVRNKLFLTPPQVLKGVCCWLWCSMQILRWATFFLLTSKLSTITLNVNHKNLMLRCGI